MKKNIIITGTSRGIGYEMALLFANEGHQVLALSRSSRKELLSHASITYLSVDLSKQKDLQQIQDFVKSSWNNQVDILIHNAGLLINKPLQLLSYEDFEKSYQVNVFSVAMLTKLCIPFMQKGSHVVTISSMGGIQGSMKFPGLAAYSSAKGAVITLSELLAEEYKEQEISFNVLALGAVQTEMLQEAFPGYKASITAIEMAEYIRNFALTGNKYHNGKVIQVSSTTP